MADVCAIWLLRAEGSEDGGQQLGEHSTHSAAVAQCIATAYANAANIHILQMHRLLHASGWLHATILHAHESGACLSAYMLSLSLPPPQYTAVHIVSHSCIHEHANSLPRTATYITLASILVSMRTVSYTVQVIQSHKPLDLPNALHRCIRTVSLSLRHCHCVALLHCYLLPLSCCTEKSLSCSAIVATFCYH